MWLNYSHSWLKVLSFFCILLWLQPVANPASFPQVWNMPMDNPYFVGRGEILGEISRIFKKTSLRTAVISGHQGFGKSQVAKRYAHQHFEEYDVVWWFRANQYIKPQFERFALELGSYLNLNLEKTIRNIAHERLVSLIKEACRRKNLKCLIIFDDAQTYKDIEPYILFSHRNTIHTLITTKNATFSEKTLQIQPFKRKESIQYIGIFLTHEPQEAKDLLANHLSDCPVALAIAVDYIKHYPGMTIERYIAQYKQTQEKEKLLPSLTPTMEEKLGGSTDGYEKDLLIAIKMNLSKLKKNDVAFQLLGLLSLLHRDEIPVALVESFLQKRKSGDDLKKLVGLINQYSFIEVTAAKNNKGAYMSMQELVQRIVNSLIPVADKKRLIDEAAMLLKESFMGRSDDVTQAILKDNAPLLHTFAISEGADRIGYHTYNLTFIRIRAFGVLMGVLRDYEKSKVIIDHLSRDISYKIPFSKEDEILYNINLALFTGVYETNYEKGIELTKKALDISESLGMFPEEQIRMIANLIQYYALSGLEKECIPLLEKGDKLLPLSQSAPYNVLYVFATTIFLMDQGEIQRTIDLIHQYQHLLDKQNFYPNMRFYTLNQLAEALIKKGEIEEAKHTLILSERYGKEFYGSEQNNSFFGNLHVLKAMCLFPDPQSYEAAKSLINTALNIQEKYFKSTDKHRNQAFAHLQLGKLFQRYHQYDKAKINYIKSERIFDKVLKNKKIDDVSELYKSLATLGIDTKDESLTHAYFKKQVDTFGLDHPKTKDILLCLDKKGLVLPF